MTLRSAVAIAKNMRPFVEIVFLDHRIEFSVRDEMIVDAFDFARAWRPRGGGNGQLDFLIGAQQHPRDGGFARA